MHMKFLTFFLLFAGTLLSALTLPEGMQIKPNGIIKFSGGEIALNIFAAGWTGAISNARFMEIRTESKDSIWNLSGKCTLSAVNGNVSETIRTQAPDRFTLEYQVRMERPMAAAIACVDVKVFHNDIRHIVADGKILSLPLKKDKDLPLWTKKLTFVLENGKTLTVFPKGAWYVNNTRFGSPTSSFRLQLSPPSGKIQRTAVSLEFRTGQIGQRELPLEPYVNRDFKDEIANDGKGGWTDQGPGNDLSMIKPGKLTFGGISFRIIDPSKNGGRGTIVLAGKERDAHLPNSITIPLPKDLNARGVTLLHASAWSLRDGEKSAELSVEYADGSTQTFDLLAGRDIMNWWGQRNALNARPAFQSWNIVQFVGLYSSHFALKRSDPRTLTLRLASEKLMWMIPAVTFTEAPVFFKQYKDVPITIRAGRTWIPLKFESRSVPGSPLDFGFAADAPAGKYGPAKRSPDGDLVFGNGRKIRLYGANLCQEAVAISKKDSDELAKRLVRNGYNTIRLHHYENRLVSPKGKTSLELDPERLDLFYYQFASLKKHGLYISLDLYASRELKKGEIPGFEQDSGKMQRVKALLALSRNHRENLKEFCRRVFLKKNPYTGLTLAEDPALISINLVNEDNLSYYWSYAQDEWTRAFREKCRNTPSLNPSANLLNRDFLAFLYSRQSEFYREMIEFCKKELGMKALLTSLAMENLQYLAQPSRQFDWIDKHCYFAHPGKALPGQTGLIPNAPGQTGSPIASFGRPSPCEIMVSQYAGKPFGCTEFNFCYPNRYRHEGTALFAAYAALQGWDSIHRFQWSCGPWNINDRKMVCSPFDAASDPVMQLSDHIATALFLRGDAAAAENKYVWIVPKNCFSRNAALTTDADFNQLGLVSRIAVAMEGDSIPKGWIIYKNKQSILPEDRKRLDEILSSRRAVSSTKEIELSADSHTLRILTPKTEVLSGISGEVKGKCLSASNLSGSQTIAAISRDNKPLDQSRDILLIHLTDVQNQEARFNNETMSIQETWGKLPLMLRKETAQIAFRTGTIFQVRALGPDGDVRGEISPDFKNGILSFKADPGRFEGGVMAYHLFR